MVVRRGPGRRYGPRRASWPGGPPRLRPPSAGLIARVPAPREPSAKWREEGGPRSLAPVPDPIGIAQTVDPSDGSADEPVVVQPITIAPLCGLASLARRPVELQLRCHDRPSQRIVPATEAACSRGSRRQGGRQRIRHGLHSRIRALACRADAQLRHRCGPIYMAGPHGVSRPEAPRLWLPSSSWRRRGARRPPPSPTSTGRRLKAAPVVSVGRHGGRGR